MARARGYLYDGNLFRTHLPEMVAFTVAREYFWRVGKSVVRLSDNEVLDKIHAGEVFGNVTWIGNRTVRSRGIRGKVSDLERYSVYRGYPVLYYDKLPIMTGRCFVNAEYVSTSLVNGVLRGYFRCSDMCVPCRKIGSELYFGCEDLVLPWDGLLVGKATRNQGLLSVVLGGGIGRYGVLTFLQDGMAKFDVFGDGCLVWKFPWYAMGVLAKLDMLCQPKPSICETGWVF